MFPTCGRLLPFWSATRFPKIWDSEFVGDETVGHFGLSKPFVVLYIPGADGKCSCEAEKLPSGSVSETSRTHGGVDRCGPVKR